jgi:hypothetical protein
MPDPHELSDARRAVSERETLVRGQRVVADELSPGQAKDDALALLASMEEELRQHRERLADIVAANG